MQPRGQGRPTRGVGWAFPPRGSSGRHPVSEPLPPWPPTSHCHVQGPPRCPGRILPLHDADAGLPQRVLQGQAQQGPGRPRQDLGDRLLGLFPPQPLILWGGRLHVPDPGPRLPASPVPSPWALAAESSGPSLRCLAGRGGAGGLLSLLPGSKISREAAAVALSRDVLGAGVAEQEAMASGHGWAVGDRTDGVRAGRGRVQEGGSRGACRFPSPSPATLERCCGPAQHHPPPPTSAPAPRGCKAPRRGWAVPAPARALPHSAVSAVCPQCDPTVPRLSAFSPGPPPPALALDDANRAKHPTPPARAQGGSR